jgi:hypothetical protein
MEAVVEKRKDLPEDVAAWPADRQIAWLSGEEAAAMLTASARRRIRRAIGGTVRREARLLAYQAEVAKQGLLEWCCSGYWAELCETYLDAKGVLSTSRTDNQRHCRRAGLYPRQGHRVCPECSRPTPPNNFGSLGRWREWCDDCVAAELEAIQGEDDKTYRLALPHGVVRKW